MKAGDLRSEFASGTEYLAACKADEESGASWSGTEKFTETPDYDTAAQLAREGWSKGLAKVAKLTDGLTAEFAGRIQREEWVPDVVGNSVDIGRFLAEEPDCWNRLEEVETMQGVIRPHVRVVLNGSASCNVGTDVITMRGAAVAALVDLLELCGFSVTVQVVFSVTSERRGGADRVVDLITVKPANERTDLSALMFWTAHPSALRRLAFAHWETMTKAVRERFGFYDGRGYSFPAGVLPADQGDIYIGEAGGWDHQWRSVETTREWLTAALSKLGVKLAD